MSGGQLIPSAAISDYLGCEMTFSGKVNFTSILERDCIGYYAMHNSTRYELNGRRIFARIAGSFRNES